MQRQSDWVQRLCKSVWQSRRRSHGRYPRQQRRGFCSESLEARELLSAVHVSAKINGADTASGSEPFVEVGSTLNLTWEVTNTGTSPLAAVNITDDGGNGFDAQFAQREFISAPGRIDTVHDAKRGLLYISTTNGDVLRYDLTTKSFLSAIHTGGFAGTIDLSPNQDTLVVSDGSNSQLKFVDLPSGTVSTVQIPPGGSGSVGVSAVFTDDSTVVASQSGGGPLRVVKLTPGPSPVFSTYHYGASTLSVSADLSTVASVDRGISSATVARYDASTGQNATTGTGWFGWEIGISRDGNQIAVPSYGGTYVYDAALKLQKTIGVYANEGPIGLVYSPVADVVYFAWADYGHNHAMIDAWDTRTLTQISAIDTSSSFDWTGNNAFVNGRMKISRDGERLFVTTKDGVMTYGVDDFHPALVSGDTNHDKLLDPGEVWTYRARGIAARGYQQHSSVVKAKDTDGAEITSTDVSYFRGVTYNIDYGDAPDPGYPTSFASNGASHKISPELFLGAKVDADPDAQPSALADADDLHGMNDDDGVVFNKSLVPGVSSTIDVTVTAPAGAVLNGWIDFNADGDWNDVGEHVANDVAVVAGKNTVSVNVPAGASPGFTFARFRLNSTGKLAVGGPASDGEVEDYRIRIRPVAPVITTTASVFDSHPTFTWTDAPSADAYEVLVATRGTAVSSSYSVLITNATTYTPPDPMKIGRYAIWVRAFDGTDNVSAWTVGREFRIDVAPRLASVPDHTFDGTPEVNWNSVPGAATYDVYIQAWAKGMPSLYAIEHGVTSTKFSPVTDLPTGRYRFFVRAVTTDGFATGWNNNPVDIIVGGQTEFLSPGGISDGAAVFTWRPVEGAVRYDLWVNQIDGQSQVIRQQDVKSTSYVHSVALGRGRYQAWARAIGPNGEVSAWSAPTSFEVSVEHPFLTGTSPTFDRTPTWTWNALPDAVTYDLYIQRCGTGSPSLYLFKKDIAATQFTPETLMPDGTYRIWYRGVDAKGRAGVWQAPPAEIQIGGKTEFMALSGTSGATPTLAWHPIDGTVRYDLWINQIDGVRQILRRQNLNSPVFAPIDELPKGRYEAWVRAIGPNNEVSAWSEPVLFRVSVENGFLTGTNPTFDRTPTWTWNTLPQAASYDVSIERYENGSRSLYMLRQGISTPQFTPETEMPNGTYRVSYRGVAASGQAGAWQYPAAVIDVGGQTEFLPLPAKSKRLVTLTWHPVDGAARYELWVNQIGGVNQIVRATDLVTAKFAMPDTLLAGTYRAWIRAISTTGEEGLWSESLTFNVAASENPSLETQGDFPQLLTSVVAQSLSNSSDRIAAEKSNANLRNATESTQSDAAAAFAQNLQRRGSDDPDPNEDQGFTDDVFSERPIAWELADS